jgi:hypothetical protein
MGGKGSSPPPAPDYKGAAQEQGAANVEAARVQGKMNNPNVVNPYGTQTTTWQGDQPTLTQTFAPQQQALYDQQVKSQQMLGGLGQQGVTAAQGILGTKVDFSGSPTAGNPQQSYQNAVDAMMQRPTADYQRAVEQSNADLASAGIPVGSKAYNTQRDLLGRQLTDAQTQAGLAGINAGNTFFNQQQAAHQTGNADYLTQRTQPLNEITALMSGSQVSNPFTMPGYAQNAQVQAAPLYNAAQQTGNYNTDVWNAKQAQQGQLQSGLFGLGGSALMGGGMAMSDRRLKTHIARVGTTHLGLSVYEYDIFGHRTRGVMADEVLGVRPEAVLTHPSGYLMVNYERLWH